MSRQWKRLNGWAWLAVGVMALGAARPAWAEAFESWRSALLAADERAGLDALDGLSRRIGASWDLAPIEAALDALTSSPHASLERRIEARWRLRRLKRLVGDEAGARAQTAALGQLLDWRTSGPYEGDGAFGYRTAYAPEEAYDENLQGERAWRKVPDLSLTGVADFRAWYRPRAAREAAAYAYTRVESAKARDALLLVGADGALKVWLNGELVAAWSEERALRPVQAVMRVQVRKGLNEVLVKVVSGKVGWRFHAGLLDGEGRELGLRPAAWPKERVAFALGEAPSGKVRALALETATATYDKTPSPASALWIARLAERRGLYPASENVPAAWVEQAAQETPDDPEVWRLAARFAQDPTERLTALTHWHRTAPQDPRAALALARFFREQEQPFEALPLLDEAARQGAGEELVWCEHAPMLAARDLAAWALAERPVATDVRAATPVEEARRAALFDQLNLPEAARAAHERLVAARPGRTASLRYLLTLAINQGRDDDARHWGDQLRRLRPELLTDGLRVARWESLRGETARADALFRELLAWAPEDTTVWMAAAEHAHHAGRTAEALAAYRHVVALDPDLDEASRRLAMLEQAPGEEETAWLVDAASLPPAAASEIVRWQAEWIVPSSGLLQRAEQVIVDVRDENTLASWRDWSLAFDPNSQRLRVVRARLYKPDGRVVEARDVPDEAADPGVGMNTSLVVRHRRFDELALGDRVEVAWRLDDTGAPSLFSERLAIWRPLQGALPVREAVYRLRVPKERPVFYSRPSLTGPPSERLDGEERLLEWRLRQAPALPDEPDAPPPAERSEILHIAGADSYAELGRWYAHELEPALVPDAALRREALRLTTGAATLAEKVERLYEAVWRKVRYVGLEFGSYAYKPYAAPEVWARGYGDCKDKAAVLIALLKAADIGAQMAIVRTREEGPVPERPASLAPFNHALVYIPALDRFVDPTLEWSDAWSLSPSDYGVSALVLAPGEANWRTVPDADAAGHKVTERSDWTRTADGNWRIETELEATGYLAAAWRSRMEKADTRREELETLLRHDRPGARVEEPNVRGFQDLTRPFVVRFATQLPYRLPIRPTLDSLDPVARFAAASRRETPLVVDTPLTLVHESRLHLETISRVRLPKPFSATEGPLSFSLEARTENETVVVRSELRIRAGRVAPERYAAFRSMALAARAAYEQEVGDAE